jgi:uncharacterized protein YfaS (alpha-2-macroglobulin family)
LILLSGNFNVEFKLNDSISKFKIFINCYTKNGIFGSNKKSITSNLPLYLEVKFPNELHLNDEINIPVNVLNLTENKIYCELLTKIINNEKNFDSSLNNSFIQVNENSSNKEKYFLKVKENKKLKSEIEFTCLNKTCSDKITKVLNVSVFGIPNHIYLSDYSEKVSFNFECDVNNINSSKIYIYSNIKYILAASFKKLIIEPHGCFEQICSTLYPTILAYEFLEKDDKLVREGKKYIEDGYKKLLT